MNQTASLVCVSYAFHFHKGTHDGQARHQGSAPCPSMDSFVHIKTEHAQYRVTVACKIKTFKGAIRRGLGGHSTAFGIIASQ